MKNDPRKVQAAILVAALGYFVDIYDLLLFSIVRIRSLESLGYSGSELTDKGILLLNLQMIGMLIGGIFWGVLADKKGRLSVLFGSICMYSIANIANGMVETIEAYAVWRFIAGVGLAGELGAGITLVSELMSKEKRGYATTIVASVGVSGAIAAYFVSQLFDWRVSFYIGGALGLALLVLRIGVAESKMFADIKNRTDQKLGDFWMLFRNKTRLVKYLRCIAFGVPLWFVVGILITFSPEFGRVLGVQGTVDAGAAVALCYAGLVIGDILSGILSQIWKSRIKVAYAYLFAAPITILCFLLLDNLSLTAFYTITFLLGFSVGYWVIFMTIAAEQFGTNIRATVTTTVPNFVRASVVPLTFIFQLCMHYYHLSMITAAIIVGIISLGVALWAISGMEETFSKDLDYHEE